MISLEELGFGTSCLCVLHQGSRLLLCIVQLDVHKDLYIRPPSQRQSFSDYGSLNYDHSITLTTYFAYRSRLHLGLAEHKAEWWGQGGVGSPEPNDITLVRRETQNFKQTFAPLLPLGRPAR